MGSVRSSLLQESTAYGVKNDLSVKKICAMLLLGSAIIFLRLFFSWSGLAKGISKVLYLFK